MTDLALLVAVLVGAAIFLAGVAVGLYIGTRGVRVLLAEGKAHERS